MTTQSHEQQTPADASAQPSGTPTPQYRPWGRIDRIHLLIWAGIALVFPSILIFALHLGGRTVLTARTELLFEGTLVFFVSLATWIMSRVEKRPLADYGIPVRQAFGIRFWEGTLWGFATLSAVLLVLRVGGNFRIDSIALTGAAVFRWGIPWAFAFLAVGLNEEFAFRGYWLFSFSRRMRFWPAALVISAVFACAHIPNHGENVLGILQVFEIGLFFCLIVRRTGNLWFAVGFHAAWDWAETFFYGTPDSGLLGVGRFLNSSAHGPRWLTGGSAGPEGSIVAIFVVLVCALLIHFRFPKAIYPDRPV